jgi:molybdate transport system substrate-binding protein
LACALIVAGCAGSSAGREAAVTVSVFAAASLRDALVDVEAAYATVAPDVELELATDASSTLRAQIDEGAPADVFLSADRANPAALIEAGLADGEAVDFAGNELDLVVPVDNPAGIASPADLARAGVKVVAAGDAVPISRYAQQAVDRLAALPAYPADYAAAVAANVVSREANVSAVVAKIELGEGDAAFVYRTDALATPGLTVIELPPEAAVAATYAGVVLVASGNRPAAHAFLTWLAGADGARVLGRFGYGPPG